MPSHHLRADARRNREAILRAAEAEFGAHGPDVAIDDIARRAGLGVGTLYRHFPTKEDLLGALVTAHLEPMVAAARGGGPGRRPGTGVLRLLRYAAAEFAAFRALADVIAASGVDLASAKGPAQLELMTAITDVMTRAQEAEQVRRDVSADRRHHHDGSHLPVGRHGRRSHPPGALRRPGVRRTPPAPTATGGGVRFASGSAGAAAAGSGRGALRSRQTGRVPGGGWGRTATVSPTQASSWPSLQYSAR